MDRVGLFTLYKSSLYRSCSSELALPCYAKFHLIEVKTNIDAWFGIVAWTWYLLKILAFKVAKKSKSVQSMTKKEM